MKKQPKASIAQAKEIARIFASGGAAWPGVNGSYNAPTTAALIKNGWLVSDGGEISKSGAIQHESQKHRLSPAAMMALELYLFTLRAKSGLGQSHSKGDHDAG